MMFGKNKGVKYTAKRIPPGTVGLEIGVWKGESAATFLRRGVKHLHLVDPWSVEAYKDTAEFGGFPEFLNRYAPLVGAAEPKAFQQYYDAVANKVATRFSGQPVTIHRMTSKEFFESHIKIGGIDWVYLDGSHAYAEVMSDLMHAGQITRGPIFGDDYGNKPGVTMAVNDYVDQSGSQLEVYGGNQYEITNASV